ncbi:ATP-binding protein [Streptomyces viridochromogenes]|uniref:ATP-binding protein n=1 Tax=Streptomyces viridochromogenes TaxID=1938 RepID=A0A0J8C214_STRVR|nr:AAA family ATPase [Streptomyces viridochromogenes]KMS71790.1 ATP-binding protein [Streptomyces viridochromogenes]KOG21079.1 ATP-binding protein [Streptomyces viridochromogenes]KOG22609.1 ATP-binding protein [Streptomyces viridochromogenes]
MIIWLNGTFGAGKTTTANELVDLVPDAAIFDAEQVGYMLQHVEKLPQVGDFQDWPPWRHLVVETGAQLLGHLGGALVVPQTVLVEQYWTEIRTGLEKYGIAVHHFVLHSDPDTLTERIETDSETNTKFPDARQWRLDHRTVYRDALPWLSREAEVIDTAPLSPQQVARLVADTVSADSP